MTANLNTVLRKHAEVQYAEELAELARHDQRQRPANWKLSPWAVKTYLLGGKLDNGFEVTPKYIGSGRLIEIAVATLATDRALLLYGVPGTAKSWVSEHLAAAISGDSTLLIQGTAGTDETALRYGWNYARLLAEGPTAQALVPSPMLNAMRDGKLARLEEMTRVPSEVQDTLITLLSEKTLPVPELGIEVQAQRGFNVIATANNRDRGVNEMSSALMRRFNTVILPTPDSFDEEVAIVSRRVEELGRALELPAEKPALEEVRRVVAVFRELRSGLTEDGKTKLKSPSGTLSTAEAISVLGHGMAVAGYYSDGVLRAADLAAGLTGAIVKDPVQDKLVWMEYLKTVVKERDDWKDFYRACMDVA
ncbi:ATPase [Burkholderia ubonensis]|uniref:ATP-binding protein n=1 Tax=Burkholderia ubonensis TaxID=101571 RepID=UPI00075A8B06|nr:AAA family ATPase [Burkholderia ubonensis]KVP06033.1 ATPase [Burkholderia ubonensis]KVT86514.1 ATPase [Burkholderia ubonensis]KVU20615.1 ATPase [Burkholderia ubonensis]KWN72088.1 ATPase [Burkholderia ubonensis]